MTEEPGTTTDFNCKTDETVTIDITANNTNFLAAPDPAAPVTVQGQRITVRVGDESKRVTIAFGFSGPSAGSYDLALTGDNGDLKFFRNISQPVNQPISKVYRFRV